MRQRSRRANFSQEYVLGASKVQFGPTKSLQFPMVANQMGNF